MRIIFDKCAVVKVLASPSKAGRTYMTVVDLDGGANFEFSSDELNVVEVSKFQGETGSLEGKFESYSFDDQKTGQRKQAWKGREVKFKPLK